MAVEAAVRIDIPLLSDSGANAVTDLGSVYTGIAVHEEGQWASLCPELDLASVGGDAEEAMNNLVQAVAGAVAFAAEEGLQPGHPTPSDDLRSFMVSGDAPFYVRKFYL